MKKYLEEVSKIQISLLGKFVSMTINLGYEAYTHVSVTLTKGERMEHFTLHEALSEKENDKILANIKKTALALSKA